ncbi:MAG TPA: OsmC family protein [Streptosporangiaceae bacterium]|nr:OsmC family protein [Streptosporangiaceae bacterium]
MATDDSHRSLTVERVGAGTFAAVNERGGRIVLGSGAGVEFTPVELFMAAIAGCTAIDVDILTTRRAEPETFEISVDADKVRDDAGNHLENIEVTYRVTFPAGDGGDRARAILPDVVKRSHDQLCTVSRTVELATPVATRID